MLSARALAACARASLGMLLSLAVLTGSTASKADAFTSDGAPEQTLARAAGLTAAAAAPPVRRSTEQLVAEARRLQLASDPMWWRLLHYRSHWWGTESEADGSPFFLASNGKSEPEAELEATLRGFFAPNPSDPKLQHPYCRFPARRAWLDARLHFERVELAPRACPQWEDFRARMAARSITLVFSSYYLNNPASAFGHTFLRLNKQPGEDGERQELLDYGINYGADVTSNNAVIYALEGLAGLFHGSLTKVPYYYKVREYNDYETRDLWEFELNLDQAQVNQVVAHIWELGSTYFDYFYLSENCSYHMLGILEVAGPQLTLLDRVRWPVIPAATIQAIASNRGLIRNVSYRPSTRSQFQQRLRQLNGAEADAVLRLGRDPAAQLPPEFSVAERVRVLDAALDFVDFRFSRALLDPTTPESAFKQRLLARRAELLVPSEPLAMETPARENPLLGHSTQRLDLGGGYFSPYGAYYALAFRLALHDLSDPSPGYPDTLAIEFLPTQLRYYLEKKRPSLEESSLISITSLVPQSQFFRSFSWNLRVGATRLRDRACDECLVARLELGAGAAADAFDHAVTLYAHIDNELAGLGPIRGGLFDLPLRLGIGPKAGVRLRYSDSLTTYLEGNLFALPAQHPRATWNGSLVTRWSYLHDFAFSVEAEAFPRGASAQLTSTLYY